MTRVDRPNSLLLWFWVGFGFLAFSHAASADLPSCVSLSLDLLDRPALAKAPSVTTYPEEYLAQGTILPAGQDEIQSADDQVSIFLIFAGGTVLYSARVPDESVDLSVPGVRFICTHRALEQRAREYFGDALPPVIAAGEWETLNGAVVSLSNRSGTYRGGSAELEFAAGFLRERGLPVAPGTKLVDYSKGSIFDHHLGAIEQARIQILHHGDPLYARLLIFYRELARACPSADLPGTFDFERASDLVFGAMEQSDSKTQMQLSYGIQLMGYFREGLPYAFDKVSQSGRDMLEAMGAVEHVLGIQNPSKR